jgi:hypothetical protein
LWEWSEELAMAQNPDDSWTLAEAEKGYSTLLQFFSRVA